jgi:arabinofuranan 3-O-arabinosyltransferase
VRSQGSRPAAAAAIGFYAVVVLFNLIQQPGRTTYDARLELSERPLAFLAGAFSLWHPEANLGELQNQAYGYLFPQGLWFVLMDALAVPDWIGQRLWSALVLIVACEGARRVARAAGLGDGAALVAGIAFAMSPRILGTVGVISSETLPGAVMPWVVLPVLLALRGRLGGWSAATLSGAAIVCMGGVNAVENIGALPLAAILVLWGVRRRLVPPRFVAQWGLLVVAASAWWVLPLLVLARFSPPFYSYVESARDTSGPIGWSEATRGDSHWVGYLVTGDQPIWPAAHALASSPLLILVAALVAATGAAGLAMLRSDLRTPLVASASLGLALLTVAHGDWAGSVLAAPMRDALDGPLQIFRNVHKIDPAVRLPLAIGVGHAAAVGTAWLVARMPRLSESRGALLALPACLVMVLGSPFLENDVRTAGWDGIPSGWVATADYLVAHQGDTAALVVPGTGFARQDWGWTNDEPLTAFDGPRWVTRSQIPLVPGQSLRFLSALDELVASGRTTGALAAQLARAGIGHVVVRRDVDRALTGSPQPGAAVVALDQPGLERVATFGTTGSAGVPALEVYRVEPTLSRVRSTAVAEVATVAGAPEGILAAQQAGLLDARTAAVLDGDEGWSTASPDIVTDSDQRRERAFGTVGDSLSAVMGAEDPFRVDRAVHDFPGVAGHPRVVAAYDGVRTLLASSSQGYADTFGTVTPQNGPAAAFDGNPDTRWVSSPAGVARDQWLRLTYDQPRTIREVRITPVVGDAAMLPVRSLEVRVGHQRRTLTVNPTGTDLVARFDAVSSRTVEVRVGVVGSAQARGPVGLRDVVVDASPLTRSLVLPNPVGRDAALLVGADPGLRACSPAPGLPDCDVGRIHGSEEPAGLDRTFTTPDGLVGKVTGAVIARATPEAARLLEPLDPQLKVAATSVYGADPRVASRFLRDGDQGTAWLSADIDPNPTIVLDWKRRQRITGITVVPGEAYDERPLRVTVRAGDHVQEVAVTGGVVALEPVRTRSLQITFARPSARGHVAVRELTLEGADITAPFDPATPTGAVCGFGPNLRIDDQVLPTRVRGRMGDLVSGRPLRLEACDKADLRGPVARVSLGSGEHRLRALPTAEYEVVQLAAAPAARTVGDQSTARSVRATDWSDARRTLRLGPGDETVLSVPENFNAGWRATLDGTRLRPVRVDGWRQGWIAPAGDGADRVELVYSPQRSYVVLLAVGLALAGGVVAAGLTLLLVRVRRRIGGEADGGAEWPEPPRWGGAALAALAVGALVVAGPVAAIGVALAVVLRRPTALVTMATLLVGSGLVDAFAGSGWQRTGADALAGASVGLLIGLLPAHALPLTERAHALVPAARRLGPWRGRPAWAAVGILAVTAVWRGALHRDSYFNQDDYYLTARGLRSELTWDFLWEPVAGHVMPAQQLCYWLVAHGLPFQWGAIAIVIVVAQLAAVALMWHLLTRLLPGRWVRVPLLAAFAWSPLTLATSLWWSAAMGLWPHVLLSLLAMLCFVRAVQGAGRRWVNLAGCVLATVGALAWFERGVLIPFVLAGLAVVLSPADGWRRLPDALRRWWQLWVGYAVLLVAYLVMHARITTVEGGDASAAQALKISGSYIFENVIPGLASGPWRAELPGGAVLPALWVSIVSAVLAVLLAVFLLRRGGRDARWALVLLVGYVVVDLLLLISGRSAFGRIIGLDPRYSADVVHLAVPAVALALRGAPARFGLPTPGSGWPRLRTAAVGTLTAVYLLGCVVGTSVLVPHFQNTEDRSFVANLRTDLARDPEQVVLDDLVPPSILLPLVGDEALASRVFAPLLEAPVFDAPTGRLRQLAPDGHLAEVRLAFPSVADPGPKRGCGYPVDAAGVTVRLDRAVEGRAVLRLEYFTGTAADVRVEVGEWTSSFHAQPGPNLVWLVVTEPPAEWDEVHFALADSSPATVCLAGMSAGLPERL